MSAKRTLAMMTVGFLPVGLVVLGFAQDDRTEFPVLRGPYLGQEPPGLTKQLFAPGVVSTDAPEGCLCFSSDGDYAVFRRHWREETVVLMSRGGTADGRNRRLPRSSWSHTDSAISHSLPTS